MAAKRPNRTFLVFSILSLVYIILLLTLPPNAATTQTYHLSNLEYRILSLLLGVPRVIVWFAAFYGSARLAQYAGKIQDSTEGTAFEQISRGLWWLAWGLPVSSIVTNIAGGIVHGNHQSLGPAVISNHFVALSISVIAFTIIGGGTRKLLDVTNKNISIQALRVLLLSFLFLGVSYCYATIRSAQSHRPNPYYMPVWLILLTVVIPYLYAWLMGLLAAYELRLYCRHVAGVLYKRALSLLAGGFGLAIVASVILQLITSSSSYLRRIEFNWSLLVLYVALVLYAIGFLLVALGANRLKKIEEV